MVKLRNPRERATAPRTVGRRFKSIAAVVATSMVAPAAFAGVATTVATTLTAAPAAASPVRTFVVSGDADSRNFGAWTFFGSDFSQLRSMITSASNFGPTGTVKTASFSLGTPVATVTDQTLAGIDVFVSGAVEGGYSGAEEAALQRFVNRGGMLLLNTNSAEYDTSRFYGFAPKDPQAIFDASETSDPHHGAQVTNPANSVVSGPFAASSDGGTTARAAVVDPGATSHPIMNGPFGTVSSFQNWHTVTGFTTVPAGATTLARLTITCGSGFSCVGPRPPSGTTTTSSGQVVSPPEHAYDQNIANLPVLAVIPPVTVSGVRHGAVIVSSDVDTYSNHASADDPATVGVDETEIYANPMLPGNETLAKNIFAYIANQLTDGFTPLASPTRILDTRTGVGATVGKVGAGSTRTLQVTGTAGIPADATAVALNVTATNPTAATFVSVYPTGSVANGTTPTTSNLNVNANVTIPNMVIVSLPSDGSGQLTFFNETGSVDLLADAVGYYSQASGDRFNAVTPDRILDTRDSNTPFLANASRAVQVTGAGGGKVPAGATAVVLNVTSTGNTAGGYLTVYPGDVGTAPNASNLNFVPGLTIPNLVIAKLSSSGTINVFNAAGSTHVIIDVLGYYVSGSNGGSFGPLTPKRVLDTRSGIGVAAGQVGPNGDIALSVLGSNGVPATGVRSVLLNVTAVAPTLDSFVTVYPGGTVPNASNLNTTAGVNVPNLVVVAVGSDGKVHFFNKNGSVHLLADVMGYYS